ncbi:6-carboxytetrahydropterin synthase [Dongshaea marina]|uniref:6-carboxytetrahydropterin synthase n=1 Tax=Dongshaea marina TaxID=2047966 RepID=UPI000D3E6F6A|nr:6-carboxytetrahydropterin synthase [Dongshaea marina]
MKLFVRDLTVIDCSLLCERRGMVGQSWLVDLEMGGDLNEMSMIFDFGRVKKTIKGLIDKEVDHRLLVPTRTGASRIELQDSGNFWVDFDSQPGSIHLNCPEQAYVFVDTDKIDAESLEQHLLNLVRQALPDNVQSVRLTLRQEKIEGASYHYSHGLKKHDGNCQRIAHGHRSAIEISVDGERDQALEQSWADRWQDIYLASEEDQVAADAVSFSAHGLAQLGNDHDCFRYRVSQGLFELALPKQGVELIDSDTTVELLADYIAHKLKPEVGDKVLEVRAFEGPGKGAIVVS